MSPSGGEFFLNKVWNALLCFIICSLNLIFTFTNRAQRKRRKEERAQEPWKYVRPRHQKQKWIQRSRESERKNGGGGHEARSMPQDKPLRSRRSHSKPGNHATLIPNFKRLHPPPASAGPPSPHRISFSLLFCADSDRMGKIGCTADRSLDVGGRAGGGDGEEAGLGRKV